MSKTEDICPIEQQISEIKPLFHSKQKFSHFLDLLVDHLSNLVSFPEELQYHTIKSTNEMLLLSPSAAQGINELLMFLGFSYEDGHYVYSSSDENMMIIIASLNIFKSLSNPERDAALKEIHHNDAMEKKAKQTWARLFENISQMPNKKHKDGSSTQKLKDVFLSKHLRKEYFGDIATSLLCRQKSPTKTDFFELNQNGYVQRSVNRRSIKGNKLLNKDMFQFKGSTWKKRSSCSNRLKMVSEGGNRKVELSSL